MINNDVGLEIVTSEDTEIDLIPGSTLVLNCTTDLAVILIEWLDQEGNVLANGTDLVSTFIVEITHAHHNKKFTCRIITRFGNQTRSVDLTVAAASRNSSTLVTGAVVSVIFVLLFISIATALAIITFKR